MNAVHLKYQQITKEFESSFIEYDTNCHPFENPTYDVVRAKAAFDKFCNCFVDILQFFTKEIKVKEDFYINSAQHKDIIPSAGFQTEESQIAIFIGLFRYFQVNSPIVYPANIKYMKDEFWTLLFQLSTIGKFKFWEAENPSQDIRARAPHLFNKTGNYYKFLRNYFLTESEYGRINRLGIVGVQIERNCPKDILVDKLYNALTIIYKLNILLYKSHLKYPQ